MSFGGSVLAMIVTLKNNARNRRKAFEYSESKETSLRQHYSLKYKTVSKEKLRAIKTRIRSAIEAENNRRLIITILIIMFGASISIGGVIHYTSKVKEHNALVAQQRKERLQFEKENLIRLSESDFNYFLNDGKSRLEKKEYLYAKIQFYNALEIEPDNFNAYLGLSETYVDDCLNNNTDCDNARQMVRKSLKKFGNKRQLVELREKLNKN